MRVLRATSFAIAASLISSFASGEVLISNYSAGTGTGTVFGASTSTNYKAFGFTMGAASKDLQSAVLSMYFNNAGSTPVVSIWSDNAGLPGTELFALTNPAVLTGTGDFTFTAGSSFTLAANTTYWLHIRSEPLDNPQFGWDGTSPNTLPMGTDATALGYIWNDGSSSFWNRLEIHTGSSASAAFCLGDGSDGGTCPCGNTPALDSGEGCTNVSGLGALIAASGQASVSSDTLTLTVQQAAPSDFGIFVQNTTTSAPMPFYNGVFCLPIDSHLVRHYAPPAIQPTVTDAAGSGSNAQALTLGDFLGDTQPGVTIYYQFWGRDNGGPCGFGANFSSGYAATWVP